MYDRVGHTSEPGGFASLTISGDDQEHRDWLGGRQLPLRFVSGRDGLVEARIASAHSELAIR
jgi:hypothetical protein